VAVAGELLEGFDGDVLILCGDVPLITPQTVMRLVAAHRAAAADATVLTALLDDPTGYGRIVRNGQGEFERIVEHRDATDEQRRIREINTGLYCCGSRFLFSALRQVKTDNDQGEYYLPDVVAIGRAGGAVVQAIAGGDVQELRGINDRAGLAEAEKVMRRRIVEGHLEAGVTILDPDAVCIDADVVIGRDTTLHATVSIRGATAIGSGCLIESACVISGARIGNNVHLRPGCVIDGSSLGDGACIGPYAHVHSATRVDGQCRIGGFVEAARSHIGSGSTVRHHACLVDATAGCAVTIGAGAVVCAGDGTAAHPAVIGDGACIGGNATLVAPLRIGRQAVVAAGATVTGDVPDGVSTGGGAPQHTGERAARNGG
jgi:bifunctional UDP-N-acetylglucosamine pyrophosphorylase/glucosamine-1-phosphate N-acetyltransferase